MGIELFAVRRSVSGGTRLSPGTFPDPPHALLPTHISLQKKVTRFYFARHLWTPLNNYLLDHLLITKSFAIEPASEYEQRGALACAATPFSDYSISVAHR